MAVLWMASDLIVMPVPKDGNIPVSGGNETPDGSKPVLGEVFTELLTTRSGIEHDMV